MTSIYRPPSSSRSLPPIPEALDRGRPKARLNTDPDVYANLRNSTGISLPPIRPTRGSKDETLPGISSIIDQSEYEHRGRRMSEAYPASPRDWDRVHSPSVWTRVDSTDGSRPSSPDLSSSTSSLSSILQDRSECASPARFLASRLPPHSAFELSDLRTSLPSHEPRRSRTPVFRSPRSTPLPLSRPMSPTVQLSPHLRPLTRRLRSLAVNEDRASVKSEPDTDSVPSSPRSKSIDISEKDSPEPPMRDEQMACTPTQPDPNLPAPWMDTESTTPTNRHSPLVNSPSPASEEDSKSGILGAESETEDEGLSYAERRARRKAANEGPIDASTVRTRGGLDWLMSPGLSTPITEIVQLQQQAERFGFKLQPDPERQATSTQSQLLYQMAERQSYIERLQREQEEAAATYQARIGIVPPSQPTWTPSIDQSFGGLPMPELAPPLLPASIFPQQQAPSFIPEPLSDLDYAFGGAATGLTSDQYLGTPGLTAASSATSASSPSESFYLSSPPPSLSHIMPPRFSQEMAYKAQDPFKADTMGFKAQDMQMGFKPQDMGFKVHDQMGFKSQDAITAFVDDEPGPSTSVMTTSGSGTHKCHSCGKTFRRPSGLKDHMNIHSGEKPYCCPLDTCRKGFATRSNMIRHHNKTHPSRPKIGGVADIGTDVEDMVDIADPTSPAESSQSRFRVVQQNGKDGVGPVRGTKERRTMRKHTVSGVAPTMG